MLLLKASLCVCATGPAGLTDGDVLEVKTTLIHSLFVVFTHFYFRHLLVPRKREHAFL